MQQRVDRLEALTERVEAISAIKRLQHAYGHYAELGLWHDFADLFADAGIGHYTQGALDREGIRSLFLKEVGGGRLGPADGRIYPHISMQPVVTLAADGQSGKGRWHIMAMLGGYGGTASWAGGVYENQYVRENGVWKFKDVRYLPQYSGHYEDPGWKATNEPAPFHFEASRVGKPILELRVPSPEPRLDVAALAKRMADLAARAQRLSDEIEVTNLQHAYGYYVDRKMWDDVADLFATDGTMEIGLQGVYAGRTSIRRGLNAFGPAGLAEGEINDRIHLQTIVTVLPDGRTARARGTEIGMTGGNFVVYGQDVEQTKRDIWLLPLTGDRRPTPYLKTPFYEAAGKVSPNGRWMAYSSDESGRREVYVQAIPADPAKWQVSVAGGTMPRWRRDGKELYFVSGDQKLMAVAVKDGSSFAFEEPQALFDATGFRTGGGADANMYQPTADGQRFLVLQSGQRTVLPITVVLNWTAARKH